MLSFNRSNSRCDLNLQLGFQIYFYVVFEILFVIETNIYLMSNDNKYLLRMIQIKFQYNRQQLMKSNQEKKYPSVPAVKFIDRTNGTIKGYAVNTFHGMAKNYNQDRVSIIMNITKPNHKGRWPRCSYFGVFDGHGGNKCSDFLKENMHKFITQNSHFPQQPIEALKMGFKRAQQQFLQFAQSQEPVQRSGSCALVVLIIDQTCYVANVGDSRAILSAHMGKNIYPISKDHKPDSESQRNRIQAAGGKIYQSTIKQKNGTIVLGPHRIDPGKLSVSRSFGDIEAKLQKYNGNPRVLIAKPQITYFQINPNDHDFMIMGSDGVYDKLTNEQVAKCAWDLQRMNLKYRKDIEFDHKNYQLFGHAASKIIEKSMEKNSLDNLTALIIVFEDDGRLMMPLKNISTRNQQYLKQPMKIQRESHRQTNKENDENKQVRNRQNQQERYKNQQSQQQIIEKFKKRKSTANLLAALQKKPEQVTNSMNNSHSSKILPSNKYVSNGLKKEDTLKININQLLTKKRNSDLGKKQKKQSLLKQISSFRDKNQEKIIRY